jgi:multidrug efflux pump subunit AcrA (membrane-fusion protein)
MSRTIQVSAMALAAMLCFSGCNKPDAAPPVVVDVQAATVVQQDITEQVEADAVLAPLAQAALAPKITAPIRKFYVQRGSHVKAGELLATLENRDLSAATLDTRGAYDAASASYRTATKGQIPEDYQRAELDLVQAKANLDLNQKIVNSRQDLFKQGALPGRDLDTAQAALVQAQATYDSAQKHLAALKTGGREDLVQNAEGQLISAKGKFEGAQAQLSYSEIRSPIDGVVTDRPLFAGETAAAAAPLLTVMDTSSLIAKTHLPQAVVQKMTVGGEAEVLVRGVEEPVPGKISLISPALDPGSTTVEVWVKIANPKAEFKAGTPVHLTIQGRTVRQALAVPTAAVLTDQSGKQTVMVIDAQSKARVTTIKTGISADELTQVMSGLQAGQRVVFSGAFGLDDGTTVQVVAKPKADSDDARGPAQ